LQVVQDCLFVEIIRFPLHDPERVPGAFPETGAQAVAVFFRRQAGLSVYNLNRPFCAGGHTLSASVAFVFIYFYDLTFDFHSLTLPFLQLKSL